MYMDGFQFVFLGGPSLCLNFLMPSFVMDTPLKFLLGCGSAFLIALSVEGLSLLRRRLRKMWRGGIMKSTLPVTVVYGMQALVAYVLMCLAMSYSLELMICLTLGLCVGHALFNLHSVVSDDLDDYGTSFDEGSHMISGSRGGRYSSLEDRRSTELGVD